MIGRSRTVVSLSLLAISSCTSSDGAPPEPSAPSTTICQPAEDPFKKVWFAPRAIAIPPGETREVRVAIEPDACSPEEIPIVSDRPEVAKVEGRFVAGPDRAEAIMTVVAGATGRAILTASFGPQSAKLLVDVRAPQEIACEGAARGRLSPGGELATAWGAKLALAAGAARDESNLDPLDEPSAVEPFDAEIRCEAVPPREGFVALGPAVTFAPADRRFLRELVFELPIDAAKLPPRARLRHVRIEYRAPSAKAPRLVPVSNLRLEPRDGLWIARFEAPRLGTYRVVVAKDAGTVARKRRLTHRAVLGFSMGGIGASLIGMNHHDLFDVVVPLGGPMDAASFLSYSLDYHFGGFCPRAAGEEPAPGCKVDVGKPKEIFQHVQSFEDWWHLPVAGTGGTFGRDMMVDIFRDVSSAWGNPASTNAKWPHVAVGIDPPSPLRGGTADDCADPSRATIAASGFYDRTFNPDGKYPVIRFCDGASAPGLPGRWVPGGRKPFEIALAVDHDGNGRRDAGEPVIVQPHEPFADVGEDGQASKDEPGHDPIENPDPSGDDYDPQYNPSGTEGDRIRQEGEPFEDLGVDGVRCPNAECPFDVGEGNGNFDLSVGLRNFQARDGRLQLLGRVAPPIGGAWSDEALARIDYYSDGGIRDIFNWGLIGQHFVGGFAARGRPVAYYSDWKFLPNVSNTENDLFDPKEVDWAAMPPASYLRYGDIDANRRLVEKGDGQHVGYTDQTFRRIQTGLYFVGSRWPDADRGYVEDPQEDEGAGPCVASATCTYPFTDVRGRTGPVTILLPPGYHAPEERARRYPVVYFLHGYGQTPEDLTAFAILLRPFMASPLSSRATRLQKMIMVFVDGRCRGDARDPECVRGTFYADSPRPGGPQMDAYFLDLLKHVDATYRTLPPSEVEVFD